MNNYLGFLEIIPLKERIEIIERFDTDIVKEINFDELMSI